MQLLSQIKMMFLTCQVVGGGVMMVGGGKLVVEVVVEVDVAIGMSLTLATLGA